MYHLTNKMSQKNQTNLSTLKFRFTLKGIAEKPFCFHEGPATYVVQLKEDDYVMTFASAKCRRIPFPLPTSIPSCIQEPVISTRNTIPELKDSSKVRLCITFFWDEEFPWSEKQKSSSSSDDGSCNDLSSSEISILPTNQYLWRMRSFPIESTSLVTRFLSPTSIDVYSREGDKFLDSYASRYCPITDLRLNAETDTFCLRMDTDCLGDLLMASRMDNSSDNSHE